MSSEVLIFAAGVSVGLIGGILTSVINHWMETRRYETFTRETRLVATPLASRRRDTENLIEEHKRRLQKLKEQRARFGVSTPPHILTEIEDLEAELSRIETRLIRPSPPFETRHSRSGSVMFKLLTTILLFAGCFMVSFITSTLLPFLANIAYLLGGVAGGFLVAWLIIKGTQKIIELIREK